MRFLGAFFTLVGVVAVAQNAQAETINAALAAAYKNHPGLKAQRAATRAVDEQLAQANGGFRPTVSGTADFGFSSSSSNLATRSSTNPYGYGITISQNLFNGFRTVNSIASAEANILASREQLRRVEQNMLQSTATAYVDVLVAQGTLAIRKQDLSFSKEELRSSQARLDEGEGTRTDVARSRARLEAARATLSAAEASLEGARAVYFQLVGHEPRGLVWPKPATRLYPKNLNQAIRQGLAEHPAVRLTLHSVDAAEYAVEIQKGSLLPTVSLNGSANKRFNSGNTDGLRSSQLSATVNLNVPIYQGGVASSQVREAREILAQRRIEVDQARNDVRSNVVNAWSQLHSSKANILANTAQVKASELALSGVIEERNVGQRTQLDVLNAQSTLLSSRLSLLTARKVNIDAGYALLASVGRLGSRDLSLPVQHYSPKKHYKAVKDLWYGLRTPKK